MSGRVELQRSVAVPHSVGTEFEVGGGGIGYPSVAKHVDVVLDWTTYGPSFEHDLFGKGLQAPNLVHKLSGIGIGVGRGKANADILVPNVGDILDEPLPYQANFQMRFAVKTYETVSF